MHWTTFLPTSCTIPTVPVSTDTFNTRCDRAGNIRIGTSIAHSETGRHLAVWETADGPVDIGMAVWDATDWRVVD
jgi:hypothetical protein